MDFQKIVDSMSAMTCVVSVEKLENGRHGKFRIVTGNKAYISSIEHPAPGSEMLTDKFIPNAEYTTYLTRDLNFEDFCYRAAVQKKCLHSYAHPDRLPLWFNMSFLPLDCDEGNLCYCLYMMEINFEASANHMSNISGDTASAVLETCIKLSGSVDFKKTMDEVIQDIRHQCDAEHCCILTMDTETKKCFVLCESIAEGSSLLSMEKYVNTTFYEIAASWEMTIAGSNCLIIKNDQDMEVVKERNPLWHASLKGAGVKSIVLFPLKSKGQLLGYIWAINFNADNAIKIKETLELTTFILGSEIGNYFLMDKLKILSSKDMLTGVMNRNEMNITVDSLAESPMNDDTPVGVIFADLNGLKNVNDEDGHIAGDTLLKNASSALREVFNDNEIFRAGGDEFTIIVKGITEKQLEEKTQQIRAASKKYDGLFFAIGGAVSRGPHKVRQALHKADELMYEDKKKFYLEHPDKKRR